MECPFIAVAYNSTRCVRRSITGPPALALFGCSGPEVENEQFIGAAHEYLRCRQRSDDGRRGEERERRKGTEYSYTGNDMTGPGRMASPDTGPRRFPQVVSPVGSGFGGQTSSTPRTTSTPAHKQQRGDHFWSPLVSYGFIRLHIASVVVFQWLGRESNPRHADFQSAALPTELPSHSHNRLSA
jgi:hypothetical protein